MMVAVLVSRLTPSSKSCSPSFVGKPDQSNWTSSTPIEHASCEGQPVGTCVRIGRVEEILPVGLMRLIRRRVHRHVGFSHRRRRVVENHQPTDEVQVLLLGPGGDGAQVVCAPNAPTSSAVGSALLYQTSPLSSLRSSMRALSSVLLAISKK